MNKWIYYAICITLVIAFFALQLTALSYMEPPNSGILFIILVVWGAWLIPFILCFGLFLKLKYTNETIPAGTIFIFRKKFLSLIFLGALLFIAYYIARELSFFPYPNLLFRLLDTMSGLIAIITFYLYLNALCSFIYIEEKGEFPRYALGFILYFVIFPMTLGTAFQLILRYA